MPPTLSILALDLATNSGLAEGIPGGCPRAWSHRIDAPGLGEFLSEWRQYLAKVIVTREPAVGLIAFEAPVLQRSGKNQTSVHTARKLMGLCGVAMMLAHEYRIPSREVRPSESTKFLTGFGSFGRGDEARSRKKRATMDACARLGWAALDDDAADALAVWVWAEQTVIRGAPRRELGALFVGAAASLS